MLKILIFVFQPEGFWFTFGKGGGARLGVREPHRLLCAYYPSLLVKVRSLALLHQRFGLPDR